jgi:hypothetical protein
MNREHDLGTALGDHRNVAGELDRVAEPLLGVEQDRRAVDGLSTPERLRKFQPGRLTIACSPAPLEFPPPFSEISERKPRQRFVPVRIGMVGPQRQRALIGGDGLCMPVEPMEHDATVVVRVDVSGLQRQRPIEARDRILVAVKAMQCAPALGERFYKTWMGGKHPVEVREGRLVPPQRHQHQAAIATSRRGTCLRLQCSAQGIKRFVVTALLIPDHAEEM